MTVGAKLDLHDAADDPVERIVGNRMLLVHARGRIHGADWKALENVARYMSRAALSVERVRYNRAEDRVAVSKKAFGFSREESRS